MKTLTRKHHSHLILWAAVLVAFIPVHGLAQLITTYAGGALPADGALAVTQGIDEPRGVISDRAGGFYVSTSGSSEHRVYRVAFDGTLTVIAGGGFPDFSGDGGPAVLATLSYPKGLALDAAGNLFIADSGNSRIRKVSRDGIISTFAGGGSGPLVDGGPATQARFQSPQDVAISPGGELYIADTFNSRVRVVSSTGTIRTVAGTGLGGFGTASGDGGPAVAAQIGIPYGIALDTAGNLFIAAETRIRKVTPGGIIQTFAGTGNFGYSGDGGAATAARIGATDVSFDVASGSLLIADTYNGRIRKITADGIITTVAGTGSYGFSGDGGQATLAMLTSPGGVAPDSSGNVFIVDGANYRVRKVTTAGVISTVSGNGKPGFAGDGEVATLAALKNPIGLAFDSAGSLYVSDALNSRVRKVTTAGVISTFLEDLYIPGGIAIDPAGNIFLSDCNQRILKTTTAGGNASPFAQREWNLCYIDYYYGYDPDIKPGLAVSGDGNLYVSDAFNNRVYRVTPNGTATVFAGTGSSAGVIGDGGPATAARLRNPSGLALDADGNLFIAESFDNRIRKVTPQGVISTVAGTDTGGFSGDGGPATSARLSGPQGLAVDAAGNLYIADTFNNRIRKVTRDGIISTVAGMGTPGFAGDDGPAISARLRFPRGVAVDAAGNLFIADSGNNRIRRVGLVLTTPTLTRLSPVVGAQGTTFDATLFGTSFSSPLTVNAGAGMTLSNVNVVNDVHATATVTIAQDAATGPRDISVTTGLGTSGPLSFNVAMPYPDLTITSSQTGNLGVGFQSTYRLTVANVGSAPTTGIVTVTDTLPPAVTYVSGAGSGWTCSSAEETVSCVNPNPLPAGTSTGIDLVVAVGADAAPRMLRSPKVTGDGDLAPQNNATLVSTAVAVPFATLEFTPQAPAPGSQAIVDLTVPIAFPEDVTGTLTLGFSPDAVNPADDPAIQFATGGRVVSFTIPANTLQARFGNNTEAGPIAFQPGTVAGTLTIAGAFQTGTVETPFSTFRTIPRQAPKLHSLRRESSVGPNITLGINLSSTTREVTQLMVRFETSQKVRLSCGAATGCSERAGALVLDVKSRFDSWFTADSSFGSTSILHIPLFVDESLRGTFHFSLGNSMGPSNTLSYPVP